MIADLLFSFLTIQVILILLWYDVKNHPAGPWKGRRD